MHETRLDQGGGLCGSDPLSGHAHDRSPARATLLADADRGAPYGRHSLIRRADRPEFPAFSVQAGVGTRFGRITTSKGTDIDHLMDALRGLRTMYLLQAWSLGLVAVILILLVLVLVLVLFLG